MAHFPTQFATQLSDDTIILGSVEDYFRHFASDYISTISGEFELLSVDVTDYGTIYLIYRPLATDCSDCDDAQITEGYCQCESEWVEQISSKSVEVYGGAS